MAGLTSTLAFGAIALLALGHLLGRYTRVAEESWWLAFGCALGIAGVASGALPENVPDLFRQALREWLLPLLVFATAYTLDRRCVGIHLFPVMLLCTTGLLLGFAVNALVFGYLALDALPWHAAALLGVVLAATAAGPVTAQIRLRAPRGISLLLSGEMPFAAAAAVTIVDVLSRSDAAGPSLAASALQFAWAFGAAGLLGAALGWLGCEVVRRIHADALPLWMVFAVGIAAHAGASLLGASPVAACLLAGLLLARRPESVTATPFWDPIGRATRGAIFVGAGICAAALPAPSAPWIVLGVVLLMHTNRLAAVYGVTKLIHWAAQFAITRREQALIAVFSTRGVTTLAAAFLVPDELPGAALIRSVALFVVAFDLLVTTPAAPWLARRFANRAPSTPMIPRKVDVSY
jgi:NhaP-type Na+/H+ or K+/H+ antiporter